MAILHLARFTDMGQVNIGYASGSGGSIAQATGKLTLTKGTPGRYTPYRANDAATADRWCHFLVQATNIEGTESDHVFAVWGSQANGTDRTVALAWKHTSDVLELGYMADGDDTVLTSVTSTKSSFDLSDGEHWFAVRCKVVNDPAVGSYEDHEVEIYVDGVQWVSTTVSAIDSQVTDTLIGFRGAGVSGKTPAGFDITVRKVINVDTSGSQLNTHIDDHTDWTFDSFVPDAQGTNDDFTGVPDDTNDYDNWNNLSIDTSHYNKPPGTSGTVKQDSNMEAANPPANSEVKAVAYYMTHVIYNDLNTGWWRTGCGMIENGSVLEYCQGSPDADATVTPLQHTKELTTAQWNAVEFGAVHSDASVTSEAVHAICADVLYGPEAAAAARRIFIT